MHCSRLSGCKQNSMWIKELYGVCKSMCVFEGKTSKLVYSWEGGLKGVEIFLWLLGMRSKSNNTFPMWSTGSNIAWIACKHTETGAESGASWSLCTFQAAIWWTGRSRTCSSQTVLRPCSLQPFILILLTTACRLPHPPPLSSLPVRHATLPLPSYLSLKADTEEVMLRAGGRP